MVCDGDDVDDDVDDGIHHTYMHGVFKNIQMYTNLYAFRLTIRLIDYSKRS